jgi:hypothetical protein
MTYIEFQGFTEGAARERARHAGVQRRRREGQAVNR